jgi:hypothetical protein
LLASAASTRASCSGGVARRWQKGLITDNRSAPALAFSPVEVAEEPATPDSGEEVRPTRRRKATRTLGTIEIDLKSGDRVRVEGCTDAGLVARIISVLRRA